MCKKIKYLNQTQNGLLIQCGHSACYQLVFTNLNFNLTQTEFDSLKSYLSQIDSDYWEKEYENSIYERKIPIPTLQTNFIILINRDELEELLVLLDYKNEKQLLKSIEIDYKMIYN